MAVVHDALMIAAAWMLAYWTRFNFHVIPEPLLSAAWRYLWLVVPIQLAVFWWFGLYRGVWRFASLPDLVRILKGSVIGLLAILALLFISYRLESVPRSAPVLYLIFLVMLLSGPRLLYRLWKDRRFTLGSGKRVLVVGAGQAGEMLVRDMLRDRSVVDPVVIVDDKPRRQGMEIHGVPVAGGCEKIPELVTRLSIDIIVLAIPTAKVEQKKRIIELCESTGIPFRTVPRMEHLVSGRVQISQLQKVSIEDLLGRDPVALDWQVIREELAGKNILVTGGGGSIGSELCRQLAGLDIGRLVVFDNSEFNLYQIERELLTQFPQQALTVVLGDVRDRSSVNRLFETHRPDIVFHAAAYKHVPMLEEQIREAVSNNVVGARCIAEAASRHHCEKFVLVSTDKAVNPANIMGATKRLAEIFCQNFDRRSNTRFITVRFGNVLGSTGSVVPLFARQIADGGPVTVTHREIERFFMTIPEACQLIMQAECVGSGGEIFVLDMGKPVKIRYLAEQMIRLSGHDAENDIEIVYTGLRPGEKLYEELFHSSESLKETPHEKILLASHRRVDWAELVARLEQLETACEVYDTASLEAMINDLVPENRIGSH